MTIREPGGSGGSERTVGATRRPSLGLRVGDWVEVLAPDEILATLDETGSLDGLPFMPEMLQYCGRRFRVYKSSHKTCDTIKEYAIRRMERAVHLEELRCDGSAHDGCQAGCLIFWKEDWLKRIDGGGATAHAESPIGDRRVERLHETTRVSSSDGSQSDVFRCQATEVRNATTEVRRRDRWNPLLYVKDLTSGNVSVLNFVRYGLFAAFNAFSRQWRRRRYPRVVGHAGRPTPTAVLNLQPGELVRVRSKADIMQTLDSGLRNRGLSFDVEMLRFCESGTFKVLRKVERIVDERTGRMIRLPNPAIVLDGVVCSGNLSMCRMFCPRAIYPYWREIWLTRAGEPEAN